ncbi:MAG TPA: glutathione S-transferase family protein [Burkholderiaceae bacterium]|nr:glutathione S-transferase family protein [Burkholderiaceae bacterium]
MNRILVIGNKNYSSWSLRPWLALRHAGVAFDELRIVLDQPSTKAEILRRSPSGKVPCLIDGSLVVWDSLAICETANERYLAGALWPTDADARAHARAVSAEMHSGFAALRTHMPMDIRSSRPDQGASTAQRADVAADIVRIQALWTDCLERSGGPLLYGRFSIADAFFAPVVTRFRTYGVSLPTALSAYADRILALPAMRQWVEAARAESEVIEY